MIRALVDECIALLSLIDIQHGYQTALLLLLLETSLSFDNDDYPNLSARTKRFRPKLLAL